MGAASCVSTSTRREPPTDQVADRLCGSWLEAEQGQGGREVERCALFGNTTKVRTKAKDMYTLLVSVELNDSVSGCGELRFTLAATFPSGRTHDRPSSVHCEEVCKDEDGTETCYNAPLKSFDLVVTFEKRLPGFTASGIAVNGSLPVTIRSEHGALEPISTVVKIRP